MFNRISGRNYLCFYVEYLYSDLRPLSCNQEHHSPGILPEQITLTVLVRVCRYLAWADSIPFDQQFHLKFCESTLLALF